ncbi:hypothetical protein K1719_034656 [Acacia pycnantha]|nr:hypothetical protein K1719_034656 [Acacia pycnantha]
MRLRSLIRILKSDFGNTREGLFVIRFFITDIVNEVMETNGGKKKSSSSKSLFYEAPLSYTIEDLRPNGGIKKFKSAAYSNCARKPS